MRYFQRLMAVFLVSTTSLVYAQDTNEQAATSAQPELLTKEINERIEAAHKSRKVWAEIQKVGRERAVFCAVCHGDDGNSSRENVPKLAAQNPVYLQDQFARFESGHRKSYIMQDLAKGLTDEDKVDLMIFYATSSRSSGQSEEEDAELIARGKKLFVTCQGCHGPDGMGMPGYANIAAQHAAFVEKALTDFRDGGGRRDNPIMKGMTQALTDDDIKALAAYIESMPPKTFEFTEQLVQDPVPAGD